MRIAWHHLSHSFPADTLQVAAKGNLYVHAKFRVLWFCVPSSAVYGVFLYGTYGSAFVLSGSVSAFVAQAGAGRVRSWYCNVPVPCTYADK